ncbi:MAG TPA: TonB family protein [Vitreimonas sp.]|uniref:TonB family protein n=1 Tax=Vitreimonas sp. TaxID=3069702 RepID=UPI002D47C418|nr:TonB family protein [Vitreimonas sp.]HYD89151.1 TonB family protein [Vitreimonas sp.]
MAQALGVRATSFVASSALLGAAVIAAFTMTLVRQEIVTLPPEPGPFEVFVPPPPPPVDDTPRQLEEVQPLAPLGDFSFERLVSDLQTLPELTVFPVGEGAGAGPPTVIDPEWVRRPRDLARYYPTRALERGVEGSVTLNCLVDTGGALHCDVVSETPANWGFAQAALRISRDYQMVPATRDGTAIAARHRMVIPFRLQ